MSCARSCLLLIGLLAAAGAPASTQSQDAPTLPSILISRQLAENRGLRVGDIVQLSPDRSQTRARPFRIAGVYEPTPDPMRFAQQRHEVRLHLPDLLGLTADPSDPSTSESVTAINVALETPSDAAAFARDAVSRLPTIAARPTSAVDERTTTFIVVERFHLAIAIVTVIGSAVFLLALMVMLVDERRTTVGTLRLLGFTRRRILLQVMVEGALIAAAGAAAGILFAVVVQDAFNRFFQWRYDTTLIFLRITPGVVWRSLLLAVPLGIAASVIASWTLLRQQILRLVHRLIVMSRAFLFAWLSLVRQPARSLLGIAGVAAIAALLFDMLLLSRGLVVSFGELLDRSGFDVRVLASDAAPFTGPRLSDAQTLANQIAALTGIEAVLPLRVRDASVVGDTAPVPAPPPGVAGAASQLEPDSDESGSHVHFIGADPHVRSMWTVVEGHDLPDTVGSASVVVINERLARRLGLRVGSTLLLRGRCNDSSDAFPPVRFTVAGIAEFPFDSVSAATVAGTLEDVDRLCGEPHDRSAEMFLVRSAPQAGALGAAAAIRAAHPELYVVTNEELIERFSRVEFSYFRQISTVLAIVTLFFGFLLITVLLTVSVNQRLAEIAALRAVGLSRSRVIAGVFWESMLLVGMGGILALPLGAGLSLWLDAILRTLPGLPARLHFFVFEPRALVLYSVLLVIASIAAAIYPMRIVSVLPIAATLRREVVS